VAALAPILDLDEPPDDPRHPKVGLDESSQQLMEQRHLPAQPGQVRRVDDEDQRNGTRNRFWFFEPLADWRPIEVTDQRPAQALAHQRRWRVDVRSPDAEGIDLMSDHLNLHKLASLYQTLAPAQANRIARRIVFHYTPRHASWLNRAEIEFAVLLRKLGAHVPDEASLKRKLAAIETARNQAHATVHWQFTAKDARTRLAQLYPSIPD
jgi:hypothetical protein